VVSGADGQGRLPPRPAAEDGGRAERGGAQPRVAVSMTNR
jgi:hypothetical protein